MTDFADSNDGSGGLPTGHGGQTPQNTPQNNSGIGQRAASAAPWFQGLGHIMNQGGSGISATDQQQSTWGCSYGR